MYVVLYSQKKKKIRSSIFEGIDNRFSYLEIVKQIKTYCFILVKNIINGYNDFFKFKTISRYYY